MRLFEAEIQFCSSERTYIVDITDPVNGIVADTRTPSGLLVVSSLHTTLGLQINEGRESKLLLDLVDIGRRLIPEDVRGSWVRGGQEYPFPTAIYRHNCDDNPDLEFGETEDDNNAARHARTMLFGQSTITRLYRNGKLLLGRFQRLLALEHDGRVEPVRERRIHILLAPFEEEVTDLGVRRLAPNAGYQVG